MLSSKFLPDSLQISDELKKSLSPENVTEVTTEMLAEYNSAEIFQKITNENSDEK